METISYKGHVYPALQASGNAARFIIPFAKEFCKGDHGLDIGGGNWPYPGAMLIDPNNPRGRDVAGKKYSAMELPVLLQDDGRTERGWDYIFSSHCLEHLDDWVRALDLWYDRLKPGGILFLYLPDFSQVYWRPWNNTKHRHVLTPQIMQPYLVEKFKSVLISGVDLNCSFCVVAEK